MALLLQQQGMGSQGRMGSLGLGGSGGGGVGGSGTSASAASGDMQALLRQQQQMLSGGSGAGGAGAGGGGGNSGAGASSGQAHVKSEQNGAGGNGATEDEASLQQRLQALKDDIARHQKEAEDIASKTPAGGSMDGEKRKGDDAGVEGDDPSQKRAKTEGDDGN